MYAQFNIVLYGIFAEVHTILIGRFNHTFKIQTNTHLSQIKDMEVK